MAQGVNPILPAGVQPVCNPATEQKAGGVDFKDVLIRSISEVNDMQLDAEHAINNLAAGKTENVTEVMAAVEKAESRFQEPDGDPQQDHRRVQGNPAAAHLSTLA